MWYETSKKPEIKRISCHYSQELEVGIHSSWWKWLQNKTKQENLCCNFHNNYLLIICNVLYLIFLVKSPCINRITDSLLLQQKIEFNIALWETAKILTVPHVEGQVPWFCRVASRALCKLQNLLVILKFERNNCLSLMKLNYQHPFIIKKYVVTYPAKILFILEKEAISNSGLSTQAQSKPLG